MKPFHLRVDPATSSLRYEVHVRGQALIRTPLLNKGSSFPMEERRRLGLLGLLPATVSTPERQSLRTFENYAQKRTDLGRYVYLMSLLNRNETLFYRFLLEHLDALVPIIYTPTVGLACQKMSHIYRYSRGIYIHPDNIDDLESVLADVPLPDVRLIVVTDGERILGLGDLGSDGMGISIGKVSLYVAAGGLHPAHCLPVCLDVGTNNDKLLADPLYMGYRKPRLQGEAYDAFVDRFVTGVRRVLPGALIQWEDFAKHNAFRLLSRYRNEVLCFNDDIQGTGATALAALLTASRIKRRPLSAERFVIVGMGQAGTGIALNIASVLREEGLTAEEVRARIFAVDAQGLLVDDDPALEGPQRPFSQRRDVVTSWQLDRAGVIGLRDVVRNARASVLVGVTAVRGMFDEPLLRLLGENDDLPVVLALSNPTSKSECTPEEVARATGGRFLMATGSPFDPVRTPQGPRHIAQCNNLYMFPGVGLGALQASANRITDSMFVAGAKALSAMVTEEQLARGLLLPEMKDVREVAARVGFEVARKARDLGLAVQVPDDRLEAMVREGQWTPDYLPCLYVPAEP